jgi:hypothetical protein
MTGVALAQPPRIDTVPPVKPDGPPPVVTIVQPAPLAQLKTHRTRSPANKYDSLDCLLEAKAQIIRLSASNWPVKPRGPGVLVVVDHMWSTVVHDLSKPIQLNELQPFSQQFGGSGPTTSPMSRCGWHFIAAVPTTAEGRMLAVEPTVTWYYNVSERGDNPNGDPTKPPDSALVIVNWPLIGTFFYGEGPGTGQDTDTGYVTRTPNHVPFDYTMVNGPDCHVYIDWPGIQSETMTGSTMTLTEPRALIYVTNATHDESLRWGAKCPRTAYWSGGQLRIYSKQPRPVGKQLAWPVSGKQKPDDNYFGENPGIVKKQIRRARCKDGHLESCN